MKTCSVCQTESSGAYCPSCGAPLDGARCKHCHAELVAGARFCTRCGEPVRAQAASRLPWHIAAAAVVVLLAVLFIPSLRPGASGGGALGLQPVPGASGSVAPPLTGSPREQADRLFDRVMRAESAGDTAQVEFFLPMAIQAYRQAGDLDADGLYHLSVLETAAGEPLRARETAERILAGAPNHILALGAAARASVVAGDEAAARGYYRRLLDAFDAEPATGRVEYLDHGGILPVYRGEAEAFLAN